MRSQVSEEADEWAAAAHLPPDPMWTESNWPSGQPSLRLYQVLPALSILPSGLGAYVITNSDITSHSYHRSPGSTYRSDRNEMRR